MIRSGQPDLTITAEQRNEVIDGMLKKLAEFYIFPEKAKEMEQAIRSRQEKKEYDSLTSARLLTETLTNHLQEVSHDKHLRVLFSHDPLPKPKPPSPEERKRMQAMQGKNNYGFQKVERLDGNIGYLELRGFMNAEEAGETAAAAMTFLANTDALIIDLRQNGGGSPGMVALLCSYLFKDRQHLNDLAWRGAEGESVEQWWTLPHVAGKRYVDKDVYVLTSKRTFSAAEEFTYNLKALKRATIVGETTGGGAHPGGPRPINDHFAVWVPSGRAINPVTKTNWEGTGVKPDVEVPADQALKTAHLAALNKLLDKGDADSRLQEQWKQAIEKVRRELEELKHKSEPAGTASPEKGARSAPAELKPVDEKNDPLAGTWIIVSMTNDGNDRPDHKDAKATFANGKLTLKGTDEKEHTGTYTLDVAKKPATIDLVPADGPHKGKTLKGIFAVDKDELKVCLGQEGKDRPTELSSKAGSETMLFVLKKAKK
jgi:uncharacterized protein (TIGR03067 family)